MAAAVTESETRMVLGDTARSVLVPVPVSDLPEPVTEILVVDPDPATATAVSAESEGARVRRASDVYCALDAVDSGRVDLIVTELCLPGAGTVEFLERLRRRGYRVPVLVLSHARGSIATLRALGVYAVLPKPASREALRAALKLAPERARR